MPDTDAVLRDVIRQWLTELPATDLDELIDEVRTPTPTQSNRKEHP